MAIYNYEDIFEERLYPPKTELQNAGRRIRSSIVFHRLLKTVMVR